MFKGLGPVREAILDSLGLLDEKIKLGLHVPQSVQAGFFYQATPDLALMGDFSWIDWSRFGTVDVRVGDLSTTAKTNYRDIYIGSFGGEYRFNERWKGSLGFTYVSSGVSDKHRTLAIPIDEFYISGIGVTTRLSRRVELHSNFLAVVGGDGSLDQGSAGSLTGRLAGEFKRRLTFALQLSMVWRP